MLGKRIFILGFDSSCAIFCACLVGLVCVQPAYAYVDPSVMTYTIQALAGVAVALSAVLGVVWRRTRKKLFSVLHIDENANKEIEPDVHRVDPRDSVTVTSVLEDASANLRHPSKNRNGRSVHLRWTRRFALALLVSVFVSFTVMVVAPYEIVAGSASSLIFGLADIWAPLALFAAIVSLVVAFLVSLTRGKLFDVLLALVVALGVCAYVQAMFLNSALPAADGSSVIWEDYTTITVISSAIWLAVIVGAIVLSLRKDVLFRSVAGIASVVLIVVQSVGVASLWMGPQMASASVAEQQKQEEVHVTEDGLYEVSSKNNVIVFVLDTFDTADMNHLLEVDPSMLDELTGFTYFPDSAGSMIPTRYGIPYLLTGEVPQKDEVFSHYLKTQYPRSSFLDDIEEEGYSIGIYSDSIEEGMDYVADKTVNVHSLGDFPISDGQAILTLGKCALYRDLPWSLKPAFWFYTDEINGNVSAKGEEDSGNIPYTMNDANYYRSLVTNGLTVNNDDAEGYFRFIHLVGAHGPFIMDENAQPAGPDGSTHEQQCRGSFKIVSEYIRQMKQLGIYDNSTIVVTADHGYWDLVENLSSPTSPILLVKPALNAGESSEPLRISSVPTGHVDYPATIIDAVGGDASKYGNTVFQIPDGDRVRYYYMTASDGKEDTFVKELEINGDVLDFSNWQLTGNEWDCTL